jgi:hypothetical protein
MLSFRKGAVMRAKDLAALRGVTSADMPTYTGHAHFWDRAVSRGAFIKAAAAATGAVAGAEFAFPALARAAEPGTPRPIPGGIQPLGPGTPIFHLYLPGPGNNQATITDFNGFVGVAHVQGTGTASDGVSNFFDADLRFMQGLYIGTDGQHHQGTFGFV